MSIRKHKVAIQGSLASYHDIAARKYFGEEISTNECGTFREVCLQVNNNQCDFGIIAIENKIAGSILLNYQLLDEFDMNIIGEIYLPIELNLYGKKNAAMHQIREILSHPMAIGQCQEFLSQLKDITVSEYKDTASCAKLLFQHPGTELAIIAGKEAGEKFDLQLLKNNVADSDHNYTRFVIISKGKNLGEEITKASIKINLPHQPGTLSTMLQEIKKLNINISKIQSIPVPDNPEVFAFITDIEFDDEQQFNKLLQRMNRMKTDFKLLGKYQRQVIPYENQLKNEPLSTSVL